MSSEEAKRLGDIAAETLVSLQHMILLLTSINENMQRASAAIEEFVKKTNEEEQMQPPPMMVHESEGLCPECDSPIVDLSQTPAGVVYTCLACDTVWRNE